jgi:tape measure domain-containing protein
MSDFANLIIRILTLGASQAANDLDKVKDSAESAESSSNKLERSTNNLANAYKALRKSAEAYASYKIVNEITQTGLEFDRMERALYAATGSMQSASEEMQFLRAETNRVGISLLGTGRAYAQLSAAAKGTTITQQEIREIFSSVAEASVVLGLSADDTKGAFRALTQVMSKSKVQAEELRGQLGERFPGAFQAAARAMNVTVGELSKMLENGEVMSDEFLPKFAREIRRTYQDAVPEAMDSAQAAFARFHNSLAEAENEIAEGGLLDALATAATFTASVTNSLIDEVKTTAEWAAALSVGQISFWEWLTTGADEAAVKLNILKAQMDDVSGMRFKAPPRPSDNPPEKSDAERREEERATKRAQKEYDSLVASLRTQRQQIDYDYNERMRILNAHVDKSTEEYKQYYSRIQQIREEDLSKYNESANAEINSLRASLQTEEEEIKASYENRKKLVEESNLSVPEKQDMMVRITADRDTSLQDLKDRQNAEYNSIVESLMSEEEEIKASYDKRREIILSNTEATELEKQSLIAKLNEEFSGSVMGDWAKPDSFEEELTAIQEFYDRRKELILSNSALTEAERTELEMRLTEERTSRLQELEYKRMSMIATSGAQTFDALAGLAKSFAGEQSGVYRAMFAASKAFALAEAVVKIQQGIAQAASLQWPTNLAAMASVVAATGSIVSTISSTNYSGAYDAGGYIPSGSVGIVGEYGPEFVQGPANVTGRKETAALLEKAAQPAAPAPAQNIRIVNAFDSSVVGDYLGSDAGERAVLNVVKRNASTIKQMTQ